MSEEQTMIERVARALAKKDDTCRRWRDLAASSQIIYRGLARAAIEAMLEPTDAMGLGLPKDYRAGSHSAAQIWQAMIDAALSDTKDKG